jgi:hypothetical protein
MIEEDITDIVAILRECAEDSRKTEGDYYADQYAIAAEVFDEAANVIESLRAEAARLRLTDKEREAVRWFSGYGDMQSEARLAEVLKGLLERLG